MQKFKLSHKGSTDINSLETTVLYYRSEQVGCARSHIARHCLQAICMGLY